MLLIVDAPTYQRQQTEGSDTHPRRGVCWLGSEGLGETQRHLQGFGLQAIKPVGRLLGGSYPQRPETPFCSLTPFISLVQGGNPSSASRSFGLAFPSTNCDDFGFHSCGPNVLGPHYPSPRCYRGGMAVHGAGPSTTQLQESTFALLFSRPISINARGIPEPWS